MTWPWKYGERQPLPPDDLPDDFSEEQQDAGDDEDDIKRCPFLKAVWLQTKR